MRKTTEDRKYKLAAAVIGLGLAAIAGASQAADKKPIGLAVANLQVDPFNVIKNSVESYAQSKGYEVITVDARGDSAAQVSQVQDLITRDIGALVYIPAGATAASVPVEAARSAGIPVVAVDRNPPDANGDTFIANDSVKSARILGEYVCKVTGGKGNVAIIQGQVGTTPEIDRGNGFDEALAKCPGLKVVAKQPTTMWMQDEGFSIAQDMLQRDPTINVIFGRADSIALGALQAVKVANLDHKVWIVGHDGDKGALDSIKAGELTATMAQPFVKMGQMAVDASIDLMEGKSVPKIQLLDSPLVNKDNVEQIIAEGAK